MTEIREIKKNDIGACTDVIRTSFRTVAIEFDFTENNNPTNGAFITSGKLHEEYDRGVSMYGLFEDSIMVGFVAIENKDDKTFYMEKLAVLPEKRHMGYGKKLVEFVKEKVRQLGGEKISVGIINENIRLKKWYVKNMFTCTSTKKFPHLSFTVAFMEFKLE